MGEGARRGFTYPPDRYPRSGDDKAHTLCVPRVRFPFPASVSTIDFVSTRVSSIHCDTTHEDRVSHRVDRISKLGKSNMGKIVHVFSCAYRNITFMHSPLSPSPPPLVCEYSIYRLSLVRFVTNRLGATRFDVIQLDEVRAQAVGS